MPKVLGDKKRLTQVLVSLLRNSFKFTQEGAITVRTCYNYRLRSIVVHVADSGIGIDQKQMSSLFSKFGKMERTAFKSDEGIGLGLTIAEKIVRACGGQISCESDGIGKGSTFIFTMKMASFFVDNDDDE